SERALEAGTRSAIAAANKAAQERDAASAQVKRSEEEMATLDADVARLRDDLKALGDRAGTANPFVKRILDAEDRRTALRARLNGEKAAVKSREADLLAALHKIA